MIPLRQAACILSHCAGFRRAAWVASRPPFPALFALCSLAAMGCTPSRRTTSASRRRPRSRSPYAPPRRRPSTARPLPPRGPESTRPGTWLRSWPFRWPRPRNRRARREPRRPAHGRHAYAPGAFRFAFQVGDETRSPSGRRRTSTRRSASSATRSRRCCSAGGGGRAHRTAPGPRLRERCRSTCATPKVSVRVISTPSASSCWAR